MADAVKITVIATGFQPENAPVAERRGVPEIRIQPRLPEPTSGLAAHSAPAVEPEPAPAQIAESEPALDLDLDDLDTPAYMRQGRLLN
jgi:hypothetical protein